MLCSSRTAPSRLCFQALAVPRRGPRPFHLTARRLDVEQGPTTENDIRTQLRTKLKAAMKGKEKEVAGSIKAMLADIQNFEKSQADPNAPASESHVVDVLRKAVDKRTQASQQYPADHAISKSLLSEISLISGFLPKSLTAAALEKAVSIAISSLSAEQRASKGATGFVLEKLWEVVKKSDVADKKSLGKLVATLLKKAV